MEIGTYPLEKTSIFQGADAQQVQKMLGVILPSIKTYARGEMICRAGETVSSLGIVLAGGATIELCDAWGNRSIIERLEPGEVFAEAYACLPGEPLMVSVTADAPTRVMFLGVSRMLSMGLEPEQAILTTNLLRIMARKNVTLSQRMMNISARTIRARLLSYLSQQAIRTGSSRFTIPFNRQELADYLGVERSALSAQMSKMKEEGLIDYRKNVFEVL